MDAVNTFLDQTFTQKHLFVEYVHTIMSEIFKILVKDSEGTLVGSAMFRVETDSIELYTLVNHGRATKNPLYKGLGQQILVVIAILAHSRNIPVIAFTAVPNAVGNKARTLFDYYEHLGATPTSNIYYNEESWMQFFELAVEPFLHRTLRVPYA